jgi:hypothetical protein
MRPWLLPDASNGHDPITLARKPSRCKEGTAWFLPSFSLRRFIEGGQVQVLIEDTCVAVQI